MTFSLLVGPSRGRVGQPMRVAVLVHARGDGSLTSQAARLLAGLLADPEFAVRIFDTSEPLRESLMPSAQAVLATERRVIPTPRRTQMPVLGSFMVEPAEAARHASLDLVLDLGGGMVDAGLAGAAQHGLWRVTSAPLGAALSGATCTEATLIRHGVGMLPPRIVAKAIYDTKPLATHNAAYVTEKSAQMILREVKRCAHTGTPADLGPAEMPAVITAPGALGYVFRTAVKAVQRVRHRIAAQRHKIRQGFSLRIGRGSAQDFDPLAMRPVPMPPNALWADPFLIAHEGAVYCFFEDYDPGVGRGHISVGRVTEAGLVDVKAALKLPHHMSYPFMFHHDGALLMMPEVHQSGRLEIWRCTEFPGAWELCSSALDGTPVADSVLFERDGTWWLFTHISHDSFGDFSSDLHVFRVDGPQLTGLVPHRLNPVVTDASTARGGGRIHNAAGRMLRVSQDNSGGSYGYGLNVMEIVRLDIDHYEERRMRHITPDFMPGLMGCHHFDALDGWCVMDVRHA